MYFEQRYCDDCMVKHWVEVSRAGRQTCHGETYTPRETPTHYTRRLGHGLELVQKSKRQPQAERLPIQWQFAIDARKEVDF